MKSAEMYFDLMCCDSVKAWRNMVFNFANDLGFEQTLLAILPDPNAPVEVEFAFLHSNYSLDWREKYDTDNLRLVDPTFIHCISKTIPLIWSPDIFSAGKPKEMYEEACGYGIRSGVTLPIHGAQGELGILCLVSDTHPGKYFQQEAREILPELTYFRDVIFETSLRFMGLSVSPEKMPSVTSRELECLKWCAAGKTTWEIAQIFHRSESAVNLHFSNLRKKFSVSSRQQVVVKAMRNGLLHL